ncbi:GntR family transcriptional regulator [Kushneria sinocarnis]|uniref:GntR family transcriptional regulator n=1 Tax=Kushneria sinocarnis TaxID=595502 RepID=A0A420WWC3_9GAMM|nr:GntR family transcriptional regulator [Kushneria sinocarnis]RKR03439.1 GntR family transcriptional regulator [Kushneria sinocarnis]
MREPIAGETGRTLGETVTNRVRRMLVEGELIPGQRLSEAGLSEQLGISRNTLREAFRSLAHEGLVTHHPNRGVFVTTPSMASIVDIYRLRRFIECRALAEAWPGHPGARAMRAAVADAGTHRETQDWNAVGTANMAFHAAIVELADSERLNVFFRRLAAELRLAFGLIADPEMLHEPYVAMNRRVLDTLEAGRPREASELLEHYLVQSERLVLAAYTRYEEGANIASTPGMD